MTHPTGCTIRSLGSAVLLLVMVFALLLPISQSWAQSSTDEEFETLKTELEAAGPGTRSNSSNQPLASPCSFYDVPCWLLYGIYLAITKVLQLFTDLAAYAFTTALLMNLNFFSASNPFNFAINIGASVVLGVANAFFILILLWIAIATIFDFEPYTARSLLLRLIIAALLINFSVPIGRAFINLSNGIGMLFYNAIVHEKRLNDRELGGAVAVMINPDGLIGPIMNPDEETKAEQDARERIKDIWDRTTTIQVMGDSFPVSAALCYNKRPRSTQGDAPNIEIAQRCGTIIAEAKRASQTNEPPSDLNKFQLIGMALAINMFAYPIAIFVLFAGAILFLIRMIALTFVLILGPLVFLLFILPATREYWSKWWSALMKWSFFLPAFLFFFFLSLQMYLRYGEEFQKVAAGKSLVGTGLMFAYMIAAAMMIGSLIIANQMGIYGASTVTGWGKKMAGAVGKWTKGTGKILGGAGVGAALASPAGRALAARRATRWMLRPAEAVVAAGRKVKEQREKAALQRRALAAKVSPKYRQALMAGMAKPERADFVREMKKHELGQVLGVMSAGERHALHGEMKEFELDDKLLEATKDLTAAIETETGIERTDTTRFQAAFNSWIASATKGDLQKMVSAEDIRTNTFLHNAIQERGVVEFDDLKTMVHTGEKAEALRQHFIDLGGRATFERHRANGISEAVASEYAITQAIRGDLRTSNPELATGLTGTPAAQINLARGRPIGRKTAQQFVVLSTPGAPPPAAP